MDLTWAQNLIYGMISGFTEILPVSAQAHRLVLRKVFGTHHIPEITMLLIHIGILIAVFSCCQSHLLKIHRAKALARIPKKRRKRPLDIVSLMDSSLMMTMLVPVILGFLLFHGAQKHENNIFLVSGLLFINGIILNIPQYLPGCNKDARTLNRLEGITVGIGCSLCALPGISCMGMALSFGQAVGEDRKYSLNMALLLELWVLVILVILDMVAMSQAGLAGLGIRVLMQSLLSGGGACLTTYLAIRLMRKLTEGPGFVGFSYYCWALALFSLILTLFA